jgi:hypothetical protein
MMSMRTRVQTFMGRHRSSSLLAAGVELPIESVTDGQFLKRSGRDIIGGVPSGATLADGDYGDITVSGTGTVMSIDAGTVGLAELSVSGTPDGSKFLRDDMSWQTPAGGPGGSTSIARTFALMGA